MNDPNTDSGFDDAIDETCSSDDDYDIHPLRCWDCDISFTSKRILYAHLHTHVKQPRVTINRLKLPPLKITIKTRGNNYEVINPPLTPPSSSSPSSQGASDLAGLQEESKDQNISPEEKDYDVAAEDPLDCGETIENEFYSENVPPDMDNLNEVSTSPQSSEFGSHNGGDDETHTEQDETAVITYDNENMSPTIENPSSESSDYGSLPGAEPTPPPNPSPDYPKIRIKTTGLLKDPEQSCTITEITDENPTGNPHIAKSSHLWSTPSFEDTLNLPDSDDNLLSLFNNNDRSKDFNFSSNDNEFISLDRLDDRNRGALQLYNPSSASSQSSLESITGLPMQALAQQVSRLQPSGNGMHQQNVLINIQQFPQQPQQNPYPPHNMYHHPAGQPMYPPPYPYQPPNPMYYPPSAGYPQHMPPPPPMNQMNQPPMNPQVSQSLSMGQGTMPPISQAQMMQNTNLSNMNQMPPSNMQRPPTQSYRQPLPPRQSVPRQPSLNPRMPSGPRQPMGPRQSMPRQRGPAPRGRGGAMSGPRGMRPRMPAVPHNQVRQQQQPIKRTPEQLQALQAKKKRFDVLTPDKDDEDCQVISVQPKNPEGLPTIESVQGATPEPPENSIMHLSDSITLSVRNPPPKVTTPQKSDAKAVANILATRGITVTATSKPKEKVETPPKPPPAPINLNGSVSIIPSASSKSNGKSSSEEESLQTVDLTDEITPTPPSPPQQNVAPKPGVRPGLPYRCDLCPAQYPNALGLSKHRQNYHKTSGGMCELGIPLINLKQPGVLQKLSQLGVHNYIPLPSSGPDGSFAIPIINARNPGNVAGLGATTMLTLGPVKQIMKPQTVNNAKGVQPK